MSGEVKENMLDIEQKIKFLDNVQLSRQLALILQKKDGIDALTKGIIDVFISLNVPEEEERDYSDYESVLRGEGMTRNKSYIPIDDFLLLESIDIENKKTLSLILLKKILSFLFKKANKEDGIWSEEAANVKLIYDLYLASTELTDSDVENLRQLYHDKTSELLAIADRLLIHEGK